MEMKTEVRPEMKTRDIWQSAYLLSKGGELEDIRLSGANLVTFVFKKTPQVYMLGREFTLGKAHCNVSTLRAHMIHLKQEVFRLIGRY